ncbi:hypothetical protein GCM10010468_09220 [Actinocorallia longicatena]|uniref:Lipoprotein n=1 Tax=Actinocorallia longicatena TaxID=111803 RepID=A0ABP6PZJ6_9ACTN
MAGSVVGVGGAAQAAPVQCATGLWKVTGVTAVIQGTTDAGKKTKVTYRGMAGIKVKITPTKLAYDFRGSKKEYFTGYEGKVKKAGWEQLFGGGLTLKAKLTGNAKGKLHTAPKSAKGTAKGTGLNTKPVKASWGYWKVSDHIKKKQFDTPVMYRAVYLCDAKTKKLHLRDIRKWGRMSETVHLYLKLVKK